MSHGTVITQFEGDLAIITLNRPEKRNALSPELIEDLMAAFASVEKGPSRVAILTGAGAAFCAGMDLAALRRLADQTPAENLADARRTIDRVCRRGTLGQRVGELAPTAASIVEGGQGLAMRDREEPRAQGADSDARAQRGPGGEERVLHCILRLGLAEHPLAVAKQRALVALDDLVKRSLVAGAAQLAEALIGAESGDCHCTASTPARRVAD